MDLSRYRSLVLLGSYVRAGGRFPWKGFDSIDNPHKSAASPPDCDESCLACGEQFVPDTFRLTADLAYTEFHDDTQATQVITKLINDTKNNLRDVRQKIEDHGDVIAKRWKKITLAGRAADTIRKVRPDMYEEKYSRAAVNFSLARENGACARGQAAYRDPKLKYGDINLLPWLDVTTLSEDYNRLLALIHHRSRYDMEDWILFDRIQLQTSFFVAVFRTMYNQHCVVMHGENFGKLVQWERDASHRGDMIGYTCAHQILRAQQKISSFLKDMVDHILGDKVKKTKGERAPTRKHSWTSLLAASSKDPKTHVGQSTYRNEPFSSPPKFDSHRIMTIIESRYRAAQDELTQAQTDPYLFRTLLQHGKNLSNSTAGVDQAENQCLNMIPLRIYTRSTVWSFLKVRLDHFLLTEAQHEGQLQLGRNLPEAYERALEALDGSLQFQLNAMLKSLPKFSDSLTYYLRGSTRIRADTASKTVKPEDMFHADKLLWALTELMRKGRGELQMSTTLLVSLIEERPEKDKARIDQSLYDLLADIAAIDEALRVTEVHRSRTGPLLHRSMRMDRREQEVAIVFFKKLPRNYQKSVSGATTLHQAIGRFMTMPLPNKIRPSNDDLKLSRDLHTSLTDVWHQFRSLTEACLTKLGVTPIEYQFLSSDKLYASEQHAHAEIIEHEQSALELAMQQKEMQRKDQQDKLHANTKPNSFIPLIEDATDRLESYSIAPKAKPKTRPMGTPASQRSNDFDPCDSNIDREEEAPSSHSAIAIKATSLKVFLPMFSKLEVKRSRTRWEDFVAAMIDCGFSATHGGGSAMTFEDVTNDNRGSIVVHRPHPDPYIGPLRLRSIGKRVAKWFGWSEETFVERGR